MWIIPNIINYLFPTILYRTRLFVTECIIGPILVAWHSDHTQPDWASQRTLFFMSQWVTRQPWPLWTVVYSMWEFLRPRGYPISTHGIIEWIYFWRRQKKTRTQLRSTMVEYRNNIFSNQIIQMIDQKNHMDVEKKDLLFLKSEIDFELLWRWISKIWWTPQRRCMRGGFLNFEQ